MIDLYILTITRTNQGKTLVTFTDVFTDLEKAETAKRALETAYRNTNDAQIHVNYAPLIKD